MARLSTHVLDIELGLPAAHLRVDLYRHENSQRIPVTNAVTNADGRTDSPLLEDDALPIGVYELIFQAGDYLRRQGRALGGSLFLDEVVIRFGIAESARSYHVPLLLASHGYSTYRGS